MLLATGLLWAIPAIQAQEQLPRREALKLAFYLSADLQVLQKTPIATDVDVKHPVALRDGDYGALVLPEAKLSADSMARAGSDVVAVGQLWLRKLTPIRDGDAISGSELQIVKLEVDGQTESVAQCALGVKGDGSGGLDLLVFGRDKSPLLKAPLKNIEGRQDTPISLQAERTNDEAGRITLRILGRYEASLKVTELEQ